MSDEERLNVIALISGGKDSFYSLLHCLHHGHQVVALANLHPIAVEGSSPVLQVIRPDQSAGPLDSAQNADTEEAHVEKDLNSFMYQTVGHQVIPLYAEATGLPLYRQPIVGEAVHHERDYHYAADSQALEDETESMLALLRAVKAHHPEANAVSSGAILSTYQRTRVESVAVRLGLVPLSFLWKYPILPGPPGVVVDEDHLLRDMATAGIDARIIKVASAGLGEHHLWERASSEAGIERIKASIRKFGAAEGATLGEGGEFESLVVDGPQPLFQKRIFVPEDGKLVVHEGGGCSWLMIRKAQLQDKPIQSKPCAEPFIREPSILDEAFTNLSRSLVASLDISNMTNEGVECSHLVSPSFLRAVVNSDCLHWDVAADVSSPGSVFSIVDETINIVAKIKSLLSAHGLDSGQITSVVIILRNMSDFGKINKEYGKLFEGPNPPARITISSGDLLPRGCNIMAYVTVPAPGIGSSRDGLHVQSRSYWAPANIGPYSQAIETNVTLDAKPTGAQSVLIAGQIPLIPASMVLPPASERSMQDQIVLSLQHLWRIGTELRVQCWTSAVAYLGRQETDASARASATLVTRAWILAHGSPNDVEESEGPDPWDLKYNSEFSSLATARTGACVPDWSVFASRQQMSSTSCIPPLLIAEVESLPRQSLVEWHAHAGIKNIEEGCVEFVSFPSSEMKHWSSRHLIVKTIDAALIYTTMTYPIGDEARICDFPALEQQLRSTFGDSLERLQCGVKQPRDANPYLLYVDMNRTEGVWPSSGFDGRVPAAVVPCWSLWHADGRRLGLAALFKTILTSDY